MAKISTRYHRALQKAENSFFLHRCDVTSYTEEITPWGEERKIEKATTRDIPCRLQYQPQKQWQKNTLVLEQNAEAILMYGKDREIIPGDKVTVWMEEGQTPLIFWATGYVVSYMGHNEIGLCAVREV
jgi:hypothetical protein